MRGKNILSSLPGICFTTSDIMALVKLYQSKNVSSFSPDTALVFILTNFAGFIFANKPNNIYTYLGFMLPALIDMLIICLYYYKLDQWSSIYIFLLGITIWTTMFFWYVFTFPNTVSKYSNSVGMISGIINPLGVFLQLIKIYKTNACHGVSIVSWRLQLIGNIGLYFLTGKLTNIFNITQSFLTAFLNLLIILKCATG
jgi:uncharacterized protein with PQ loop repeat